MPSVYRGFVFLLVLFSTWYASGSTIKKDLRKIKLLDTELKKLTEEFRERNFLLEVVKFKNTRNAKIVASYTLEDFHLKIDLWHHIKEKSRSFSFPFERMIISDKKSFYVDLNFSQELYLSSEKEVKEFGEFVKKFVKIKTEQEEAFDSILLASQSEEKKLQPVSLIKIKRNISETSLHVLERLETNYYKGDIIVLFSRYLKEFAHVKVTLENEEEFLTGFRKMALSFFDIIDQSPKVLLDIGLETVTHFLDQVIHTVGDYEDVSYRYEKFYLDNSYELLRLLRQRSNENGRRIKDFFQGDFFNEDIFYKVLKIENDILLLSQMRQQALEGSTLPSEKFLEKKKIDYCSSFKSLQRVSQVHIFLLLDLYRKLYKSNWEERLTPHLEEFYEGGKVDPYRDFSMYGRWSLAGGNLRGQIKMLKYCKNKNSSKEVIATLSAARIYAEKYLREKAFTYEEVMKELGYKKYPKADNLSAQDILSIINPSDLKRFFKIEKKK